MKAKPDLVKIAGLPLNDQGELLIVKWKSKPIWFSLGGVLEKDETEVECLKREVQEELLCDVVGEPEYFCETPIERAAGRDDTTIIVKFYLMQLPNKFQVDNEEIEDHKWLSQATYQELLSDDSLEIGSGLVKYAIPQLIKKELMAK